MVTEKDVPVYYVSANTSTGNDNTIANHLCHNMKIVVETVFSIYNGQTLVQVGDLIKHWDKATSGEAPDGKLSLLPKETRALKIVKIKEIKELSTGHTVEGVIVTADAEPVF